MIKRSVSFIHLSMEEQKNVGMGMKGGTCECGCGCGWAMGHRWFRVVLALIILFITFAIGVKAGEVKSRFRDGFYGGRFYYQGYPGYPMMNGTFNSGTAPMMNL